MPLPTCYQQLWIPLQKPAVVVVGATGKQGGAVVNALLAQGRFGVRALTRDGSSQKATALAARQVEIAQGNLEDTSSLLKASSGHRTSESA